MFLLKFTGVFYTLNGSLLQAWYRNFMHWKTSVHWVMQIFQTLAHFVTGQQQQKNHTHYHPQSHQKKNFKCWEAVKLTDTIFPAQIFSWELWSHCYYNAACCFLWSYRLPSSFLEKTFTIHTQTVWKTKVWKKSMSFFQAKKILHEKSGHFSS